MMPLTHYPRVFGELHESDTTNPLSAHIRSLHAYLRDVHPDQSVPFRQYVRDIDTDLEIASVRRIALSNSIVTAITEQYTDTYTYHYLPKLSVLESSPVATLPHISGYLAILPFSRMIQCVVPIKGCVQFQFFAPEMTVVAHPSTFLLFENNCEISRSYPLDAHSERLRVYFFLTPAWMPMKIADGYRRLAVWLSGWNVDCWVFSNLYAAGILATRLIATFLFGKRRGKR